MPRHNPKAKHRLDISIDEDLYQKVHVILQDPMRHDGRKQRGSLATLISVLLTEWLASGKSLHELTED